VAHILFGFEQSDIKQLAETLSHVLNVRLNAYHSPIDGPWYSSIDYDALYQETPESENPPPGPYFKIGLNDPEPGYTAPQFPRGGRYLLGVRGEPAELEAIERKLSESGLSFKRLK
jgi:hypothetical protein